MTKQPTIERIAELQQLIADFADVFRVPHIADKGRPENDAEHSYGLALTAWYLASHIAPELDQAKILKYALAHDLVEIHAGDTFVFADQDMIDSKADRETAAVKKLSESWPDFPEMSQFALNYKDKVDEEAKFVYALDKILPVIMVNLGEKQAFWEKYKITLQKQMNEKESKMKTSKYIAPYYDRLVEWMSSPNYFYDGDTASSSQQM